MQLHIVERVSVVHIKGVPVIVADSKVYEDDLLIGYAAEVEWPSEYDQYADDYLLDLTPMMVNLEVAGLDPQIQRHSGGVSVMAMGQPYPALARAA